jgi:uncharacterized protein with PIN domain
MKTREELLDRYENEPTASKFSKSDKVLHFTPKELKEVLSVPTEQQMKCKYCHEPFLDLSGQSVDEMFPEDAYCNFEKDGLNYGAGEFEDGNDKTIHVNFCPMCGRKLGDE